MNILENDKILIHINNFGAELCKIYSKQNKVDYLWNGDKKYWGRYSPVLFPIVGRLNDNETYINSKKYEMSQHGFARDMEFNLVSKNENKIEFTIQYNEETLKKYPYKFRLNIIYTLKDSTIDITWKVKNIDDKEILFSIGAHPAFNIPFNNDDKLEDYYLSFKYENNIKQYSLKGPYLNEYKDISQIENLHIKPEIFKDDAIIYSGVQEITINSKNRDDKIKVSFKGFPYVGVWSPYNESNNSIAPFVCIEPWYGIADKINSNKKFEDKIGINKLDINEEFETTYSISII